MATGWYGPGLKKILAGTINGGSATFKLMLLGSSATTYVYDADHEFIDRGTNDSADPSFCEAVCTDYTGGFGGGGRKTVTVTWAYDSTNNRVKATLADTTWTGLGGATNDTITHALLVVEDTNDTASHLIACFDITNTTSNNTDFTLLADATNGNLRLTLVDS